MERSQAQINQDKNHRQQPVRRRRGVGNVRRIEKQRINQDWDHLQRQRLPNNASSDQIFNASYQNQGLQPQNLSGPASINQEEEESGSTAKEGRSRFSRINSNKPQPANQSRRRRRRTAKNLNLTEKPPTPAAARLAKRGLARGRVTTVNSSIFLVGGGIFKFVQLPLAIGYLVSAGIYALLVSGVGVTGSVAAWWYNVKDIIYPLFAISGVMMHVLGLFILLMIYLAYRSAHLKPLSGSKELLKYAAFAIAILGYSTPLLSLAPWGLLVMGVVWLYPE